MPDERLPKKILYGELQIGKRSYGGQKKRYKNTLKASPKDFNRPTELYVNVLFCFVISCGYDMVISMILRHVYLWELVSLGLGKYLKKLCMKS